MQITHAPDEAAFERRDGVLGGTDEACQGDADGEEGACAVGCVENGLEAGECEVCGSAGVW